MTIEPLRETFGFGTPAFNVLNPEFRTRVLQEAHRTGDLCFCLVWALDHPDDLRLMESYVEVFEGDVAFVELRADLDTRLQRNRTEERLLHKASKRDVEWSDANVREMEVHQMSSASGPALAAGLLSAHPHLVVETAGRSVDESADVVVGWLADLRR